MYDLFLRKYTEAPQNTSRLDRVFAWAISALDKISPSVRRQLLEFKELQKYIPLSEGQLVALYHQHTCYFGTVKMNYLLQLRNGTQQLGIRLDEEEGFGALWNVDEIIRESTLPADLRTNGLPTLRKGQNVAFAGQDYVVSGKISQVYRSGGDNPMCYFEILQKPIK